MRSVLYRLWQCTWGCIQTLAGLLLFWKHRKNRHFSYHGAIVTEWGQSGSISLGMFVFVDKSFHGSHTGMPQETMQRRLLVHEYGHTIQSLLLGPLYLVVIGIASFLWGFLPRCRALRKAGRPYCAFFTERWANAWGEAVTKEPSLGMLCID